MKIEEFNEEFFLFPTRFLPYAIVSAIYSSRSPELCSGEQLSILRSLTTIGANYAANLRTRTNKPFFNICYFLTTFTSIFAPVICFNIYFFPMKMESLKIRPCPAIMCRSVM